MLREESENNACISSSTTLCHYIRLTVSCQRPCQSCTMFRDTTEHYPLLLLNTEKSGERQGCFVMRRHNIFVVTVLPTVIVCLHDRAATVSCYTKNCRWQAARLQVLAIFSLPRCRVEKIRIARCTTSGQGCYFTVHWNRQKLFGCAGNRHTSCSIVTFLRKMWLLEECLLNYQTASVVRAVTVAKLPRTEALRIATLKQHCITLLPSSYRITALHTCLLPHTSLLHTYEFCLQSAPTLRLTDFHRPGICIHHSGAALRKLRQITRYANFFTMLL